MKWSDFENVFKSYICKKRTELIYFFWNTIWLWWVECVFTVVLHSKNIAIFQVI